MFFTDLGKTITVCKLTLAFCRKRVRILTFAFLLTLSSACSHSPLLESSSGKDAYYEAAYFDRNRAPASVTPPPVQGEKEPISPMHMRTQADYYFSMGEALSLEGDHEKAVEAFKSVLIYDAHAPSVHLRLAAEYMKLGLTTEALEQADLCLKKDPKSFEAHIVKGSLYSSTKMYPAAIKEYEQVLKLDSHNTDAPLFLGAVWAERKQYDKAIGYFDILVKNSDYATPFLAHYYKGRVRLEQGTDKSKQQAIAEFNKTLDLKPDFVDALMILGQIYQKDKKTEEAVKLYRNHQIERGSNPRVADALAQIYLETERFDLAYEQLKIVESMGEDQVGAKVRMGLIQVELKNYDLAVSKFKEVLDVTPESDKIRFYLAAIYKEKKQFPEAIEEFKMIPALSSHYGEAIVQAAYLQKMLKQNDEAIKTVKEGMKNRQDVPQMFALYGSLLEEKGDLIAAEAMLIDALERFPENAQLRFFLGTLYDRLAKSDMVVEQMKKVLEIDPNHVQALNYLAYTYADQNKHLDDAEMLARKAAKLDPTDGYILDTLGWVLFKQEKYSEAIKTLEKAYAAQPNESIIAEHLGDAYYKFQLVEKARVMYKRAVEVESDELKLRRIKEKLAAMEPGEFTPRQPAALLDQEHKE